MTSLRTVTAMLVLLAATFVLGLYLYAQAPAIAQEGSLDPAPDPRVAGIERDFLMGMIPHHRATHYP